jgi:hypothetical protein
MAHAQRHRQTGRPQGRRMQQAKAEGTQGDAEQPFLEALLLPHARLQIANSVVPLGEGVHILAN